MELKNPPFKKQNYYLLNGQFHEWNGPVQKVFSPLCPLTSLSMVSPGLTTASPEKVEIGHYPLMTERESLLALTSSIDAYGYGSGVWPTMRVEDRIGCMKKFTQKMIQFRDEVVHFLMWEIGKNQNDSYKEFDRTVKYIYDTINALKDLDRLSSRFEIEDEVYAQIRRAPLGVVLCMGPFNYPLNETFTTLIPALIMGNVVIFKPPKYGVLLHEPLLKLFQECFPPGVVNTLYGDGPSVISPILRTGKIDCLAFIGTSRVADLLKTQHPKPHRLRSILGLEAKNQAIILESAPLDLTVNECIQGALSFNGQRCTGLKLLFAQTGIYDQFASKFAQKVDDLTRGMPWENPLITPLPEDGKQEFLTALVRDATEKGAKILTRPRENQGFLFHPIVLGGVTSSMRIFHEEQFGPIVPLCRFNQIEEPIQAIINSPYGQQVSLFATDSKQLARLIDPLVNQVSRVNINSQCQRGPDSFPFTGRKDSAEGTLSVTDALRAFSIRTLVAAKNHEINKRLLESITRSRESGFLSTDYIF